MSREAVISVPKGMDMIEMGTMSNMTGCAQPSAGASSSNPLGGSSLSRHDDGPHRSKMWLKSWTRFPRIERSHGSAQRWACPGLPHRILPSKAARSANASHSLPPEQEITCFGYHCGNRQTRPKWQQRLRLMQSQTYLDFSRLANLSQSVYELQLLVRSILK